MWEEKKTLASSSVHLSSFLCSVLWRIRKYLNSFMYFVYTENVFKIGEGLNRIGSGEMRRRRSFKKTILLQKRERKLTLCVKTGKNHVHTHKIYNGSRGNSNSFWLSRNFDGGFCILDWIGLTSSVVHAFRLSSVRW